MLQLDFYNFIFFWQDRAAADSFIRVRVWTFADDMLFSLAKNENRPVPF